MKHTFYTTLTDHHDICQSLGNFVTNTKIIIKHLYDRLGFAVHPKNGAPVAEIIIQNKVLCPTDGLQFTHSPQTYLIHLTQIVCIDFAAKVPNYMKTKEKQP